MLDYIKGKLKEVSSWQGIIALVAAVVMYFTPDEIDKIIYMLLGAFGITSFVISEKKN